MSIKNPRNMSYKAFVAYTVFAFGALSLTACGPSGGPDVEELDIVESDPITRDRTAVDRPTVNRDSEAGMTMEMDGGMDGGTRGMDADVTVPDGGMDSMVSVNDVIDVPTVDSVLMDVPNSEIPVIIGVDVMDEGIGNCDQMNMLRACMGDGDCRQPAEKCLPTGCGGALRCQPAGRSCANDTDCLAGTQRCTNNVCVAIGADCGDVRACPLGFACEGAAGSKRCINRRRVCEQTLLPCPVGDVCIDSPGIVPFCALVATRCASNSACLVGSMCVDADGDGLRECVPSGPCRAGMCADPGDRCEVVPTDYFLRCGRRGICSMVSGCAAGFSCVDPWGAGVGQCRSNMDACRTHDMCAGGQICFEPGGQAMAGSPAGCR